MRYACYIPSRSAVDFAAITDNLVRYPACVKESPCPGEDSLRLAENLMVIPNAFSLANESMYAPKKRVLRALKRRRVDPDDMRTVTAKADGNRPPEWNAMPRCRLPWPRLAKFINPPRS
jgi:hypothetical protein